MTLFIILSGLVHAAVAQQSATVHATATVAASYSSYRLTPVAGAGRPMAAGRYAQQLAVPGLGLMQVEGAAGAQVRLAAAVVTARTAPRGGSYAGPSSTLAAMPGSAGSIVRASIAYVAN